MKIFTTLISLLFFLQNFAQVNPAPQNTDETENYVDEEDANTFAIRTLWRFYPISAVHFGENAFAEAHENGSGFGGSLGLAKYGNFRMGFGYEFTKHQVSDVSKVGNFSRSNNQSLHLFVSYDYEINKTFLITPVIGYGGNTVNQRDSAKRFGRYGGNHFRMGCFTDVSLNKNIAVFVGIHYINTQFGIKTNAAFQDYFEKSQQVQFSIGIKLH